MKDNKETHPKHEHALSRGEDCRNITAVEAAQSKVFGYWICRLWRKVCDFVVSDFVVSDEKCRSSTIDKELSVMFATSPLCFRKQRIFFLCSLLSCAHCLHPIMISSINLLFACLTKQHELAQQYRCRMVSWYQFITQFCCWFWSQIFALMIDADHKNESQTIMMNHD